MKNLLFLLGLVMVFSSCSRENNVESASASERNNEIETAAEILPEQELKITKYVKAPAGLRVRNSPDINAERIGVLDDLTEVLVLKEDENNLTIDGISGKWTLIETDDIQGWVFGGFLSNTTMLYILDYIYEYFNFYDMIDFRENNTLEGFLSDLRIPSEYRIIRKYTSEGIHGNMITTYVIESNQYELEIWEIPDISRHLLISISIELDEGNFLNLFPHRSIGDFLADKDFWVSENLGITHIEGSDSISYGDETFSWVLHFRNGLLYSISHVPYMP